MRNSIKTAAIAAVVSLGIGASSATAASMISSAQVKDNTLTSKDIKNGSLKLEDMSPAARVTSNGVQGPAGPAGTPGMNGVNGATGAQGIQGPAGGFDPSKAQYIAGPTVTVTPGGTNTSSANCPPDTKVIGGGYLFGYSNGGVTVEVSAPRADGSGWIAGFGNNGSVSGEATAYAVCAAK